MAKQALNTIKNWFKTGLKPTQIQFFDTWDSFWHKDDAIPAASIENLDGRFDEKADVERVDGHLNDEDAHNLVARLVEKVNLQQLNDESDERSSSDNVLQGQIDELFEKPAPSLEQVRANNNKILGDIDFNGNTGVNVITPTVNGQIANKEYADQKETNAKAYADSVATDVLRFGGYADASTGLFPTTGTGSGGTVRRGDTYEVNVAGTIGSEDYEIGDSFRALVNTPAQDANKWNKGQTNLQQATSTKVGVSRFATAVEAKARLSESTAINPSALGIVIVEEKKNVNYQTNPQGSNEASFYMENAGQVNSLILAGANTGKLKLNEAGTYPVGAQTFPFAYGAGDRVFVTFNYDNLSTASANIKIKCKDN